MHQKIMYLALSFFISAGIANPIYYQWSSLEAGAYLDHWEGSNPLEWKNREGEPIPPIGPPPQSFYNLAYQAYFGIPAQLNLGIKLPFFYHQVESYETYWEGKFQNLTASDYGIGDIEMRLGKNFSPSLYMHTLLVIPGIYQKSKTNLAGGGAKTDAWTGLGMTRAGLGVTWKTMSHFVSIEQQYALPSGHRSQIDAFDFDIQGSYDYTFEINSKWKLKPGLFAFYKNYHWKTLNGDLTREYSLFPKLSISHMIRPNRELSWTFGFSAYSNLEDTMVESPSGAIFSNLYIGFY